MTSHIVFLSLFFFNDTATTEIYTLSLHDALPISAACSTPTAELFVPPSQISAPPRSCTGRWGRTCWRPTPSGTRSEEHTSELQSRQYLVCRLLLEKKKKNIKTPLLHSNTTINTHT